jgi:hypothetical protein
MGASLSDEYLELQPTGHICANCGSNIKYGEECWLIQIVQPQLFDGRALFHVIINEEDVDGDFLFEPYFFCFGCWESGYSDLKDQNEDEPPVKDEQGLSPFECVCCGSDIREWEYAGTFTLGEFRISKRAPNNIRGPRFVPNCNPELLCFYDLVLLNEGFVEMWDPETEPLTQFGECNDCIQLRCWRYGATGCSCSCHKDDQEDDGEQE